MSRKGNIPKREIAPDKKYGSVLIQRFINKIMLDGKKNVAEQSVYAGLEIASKKLNKTPMEVFQTVLDNVSPMVQLRSRRVGGANYQIPMEVSSERRIILAMQWLVRSARSRKGVPLKDRLASEFMDAFNNTGGAVKKKEETHKMAEANRAFAHFARF